MGRIINGFFILFFFLINDFSEASAQDAANRYSIIFGWKTGGGHELLSRQASALSQWKDTRSLAFSFGAMLGPTLIVNHDTADQFLKASREAGFDYIIPAAPEFMFGIQTLKKFSENDNYPRFLSANILDEKTRRPVFEPYAMWYVSGLRICVIAMADTSIIRESKDANVSGIDIVSHDEALRGISDQIAREKADLVVVAGRLDRDDIEEMVKKHPFIGMYLTNNQSGGFLDAKGTTAAVLFSDKPVYIGPEAGNQLGIFSVKDRDGYESREFTTITLGDAYPPDKELLSALTRTLDEFKRRETEEQTIVKTGSAAATLLKDLFKVDAVLLERQSMFYFPLTDSLTIFNIRKVIRPYTKLAVYDLKGSALKSILEESKSRIDPDYRLIIAGMTVDGKIDSIPIGDDAVYTVVTTTHLRAGGNGYPQFREGMNEQRTDINALMAVERFLVEKDERIQRAIRPKKWNMVLNLAIGSNFNKQDVNDEKGLYGNALPTQFKNLSDQFFGHIRLGSEGNNFTYKKNKHTITTKFNMVYQRTGTKPIKGPIVYRKATDFVRLDGRYEYDILTLGSRPYMDMTINSIFYSGKGKHPISANISTGFTRKIPKLWLETSIGVNGARNYFSNQNTLGTKTTFSFKKSFPPMSIFTGQTDLSSDTEIFWSPSALAKSEFRHENHNRMNIQLMKKLGLAVGIHTYSYRTTKFRKSAVGIHYDLNLTYGMQWKL